MGRLDYAMGEDMGGESVSSRNMEAYHSGQSQQEDVMARKTAGIAEADARRAQIMAAGPKPAAQPKNGIDDEQGGQMPKIDAGQVMSIVNQFSKKKTPKKAPK